MKFRTVSSMLLLALVALVAQLALGVSARAEEKRPSVNAQRLEVLKSLAGEWVALDKDGKPTDTIVSSIRVTSAGSAVLETLFPGTDHEMVTLYHLDGADLILTHYCMMGNQPRMRAEPGKDINTIVFKLIGGTNMKSTDDRHMHRATLVLEGKDRFKAEWVSCQDGKTCHQVRFDLVRKQK